MDWCLCSAWWEFVVNSMPSPEWAVTFCPCSFGHHAEQSRSRWKTTCKRNDWHPFSDISHNRDCQLEKCYATVFYPWKGLGRVLKAPTAVGWKWMNIGLLLSTAVLQGLFGLCLQPVWFHPTSWSCTACFSHRHPSSAPFVACTEESCLWSIQKTQGSDSTSLIPCL